MSEQDLIKLKNVSFSFNSEAVLQDITLNIRQGDYVGIVGPNGGGKSTLIKVILGLLKPDRGEVILSTSKIGYVPQKTDIEMNFPVTVKEVIAMGRFGGRGLFKFPNTNDKKRVWEALKQVGMTEFAERRIGDLSGGQQQRVFIARALAGEPEIIFLDEPTVGVDIKTQKQFYRLLRKLNKELGLTLVLVSHELDVVSHECNQLIYLNCRLVYAGTPGEFMQGKYFHELIGREGLHQLDV